MISTRLCATFAATAALVGGAALAPGGSVAATSAGPPPTAGLPTVVIDPAKTKPNKGALTLSYRGLRAGEEPVNGIRNPHRGYRLMNEYYPSDMSDPFAFQQDTRSWDGEGLEPSDFVDWVQPKDIRQALPSMEQAYKTQDQRVTQLYFYLTDYVCKTDAVKAGTCDPATYYADGLPQVALDNIRSALEGLREIGYTAVLRFAYDTTAYETQYTVDKVKQHIAQLAPIVSDNADVVSTWQSGFFGAWGEWGGNSAGCVTNAACANDVIAYLVSKLPPGMDTTVRTTRQRGYVTDPRVRERVGFNDDGFLSGCCQNNPNDPQIVADAQDVFYDAEMFWNSTQLAGSDPYAKNNVIDPMESIRHAQTEHIDTFSRNHNPLSYLKWKGTFMTRTDSGVSLTSTTIENYAGTKDARVASSPDYFLDAAGNPVQRTAYDFMRDHLGYRLQLDRAVVDRSQGSTVPVRLELRNFGYAAPKRPAPVQLVVLDSAGKAVRTVTTGADWRTWYSAPEALYPGANAVAPTHVVEGNLDLSGLPADDYRLAVRIPATPGQTATAARFANGGSFAWTGTDNVFARLKVKR